MPSIETKTQEGLGMARSKCFLVTDVQSPLISRFLTSLWQDQDWESGSEIEGETWYPANMEELVTVDEVGEDDLIMEPDITELEEIVPVDQKSKAATEMCSCMTTMLELENDHSRLTRNEEKLTHKPLETNYRSAKGSVASSICQDDEEDDNEDAVTEASSLNLDPEQKPEESQEDRSAKEPDHQQKEVKNDKGSDTHLEPEDQHTPSVQLKEEALQFPDAFIDDYKQMASQGAESREVMEMLVKNVSEETRHGSQECPEGNYCFFLFGLQGALHVILWQWAEIYC